MFGMLRLIVRSGGAIAVCLGMIGLAFYGIAQMSVMIVDEPTRGLQVLGVFFALSFVFCLMMKWVLRQVIAQALRPIDAAREATSRLVSIGEEGGKKVFRSLGKRTRDAGSTLTWAVGGAARTLWRVRYIWPSNWRGRRRDDAQKPADVIPLKRNREGG
ncbi:MAG: hypothetical protein OXE44_00445 [Nitrospinae bacterium]|nr:hypothetical protein [Nitrospinota bacterium]